MPSAQTGIRLGLETVEWLNDLDRSVLAFEAQWWKRPGAKEQAIRDLFDLTPTRYYMLLNALLE